MSHPAVSVRRIPIRARMAALGLLLALGPPSMGGLALAVDGSRVYTVKPGDTLGAISAAVGVSMARLAALNKLSDADLIIAGQRLLLPDEAAVAAGSAPAGLAAREYTIRAGDSLSRIATEFGITIAALIEANKLATPDRLSVGQKLVIPSGARSTGAAGQSALVSSQGPASAARDAGAAALAAARAISGSARVGIAARNLSTGERIDVRSAEVFPSASINKVPIMAETFRQISNGQLARTAAIDADLERMITLSDNYAADRLVDKVGEQSINGTMANLGLGSTALRNYFSDRRGASDPGFNQTSPSDAAALFGLLANNKLVSASGSQEMRGLLLRNQDPSKLARGLPPGTRVAHKSGWYTGVANDAGIVYAPRGTYVLAVFSQGTPDTETGNQLVASVSRAVYEAWGR